MIKSKISRQRGRIKKRIYAPVLLHDIRSATR